MASRSRPLPPDRGGSDDLFVLVTLDNLDVSVFPAHRNRWMVLFRGPSDRRWPEREQLVPIWDESLPWTDPEAKTAPHASIAVVPHRPNDYSDFVVAVTHTESAGPGSDAETQVRLRLLIPIPDGEYAAWPGADIRLTGAGHPHLPILRGGRASVAADEETARWVVAVEDLQEGRVHVLTGLPTASSESAMSLVFSSPRSEGWRSPQVAVQEGEANVVAFGAEPGDVGSLSWAYVEPASGNYLVLPTIHGECLSPADIGVKRGDAYVAAECRGDDGEMYVGFFEKMDRGILAPTFPVFVPASDHPRLHHRRPAVAVTYPGTPLPFDARGYTQGLTWTRGDKDPRAGVWLAR
jgi:hypothetical protein